MIMIRSFMELLVAILVNAKTAFLGDLSWDVLFFLCILAYLAGIFLVAKYTKQYDAKGLKEKWLGMGKALHWIYFGRNLGLKIVGIAALLIFWFAAMVAGTLKNGQIADINSPLTNFETGVYQIMVNCGEEPDGGTVLYLRQIINVVGEDEFILADNGQTIKARPNSLAPNTDIGDGNYISYSLFQGHAFIANLDEEQIIRAIQDRNNFWWNRIKGGFATIFSSNAADASTGQTRSSSKQEPLSIWWILVPVILGLILFVKLKFFGKKDGGAKLAPVDA